MLEGRKPHFKFLKRCKVATPMFESIWVHFAFGKRVWTRYAPTIKARAAICVQRFDDSLNPAIHITYRVSRRSSSLREPRDPSLKGGCWFFVFLFKTIWWMWVWKKLCDENLNPSLTTIRGFLFFEFVNVIDPSAGSPTETLLRLLLPRNVQI